MCQSLKCDAYMLLGTSSNSQLINMSEISNVLGEEFCSALIGFHIFTGWDTCSAFKGKGKIKPLNLMRSNHEGRFDRHFNFKPGSICL